MAVDTFVSYIYCAWYSSDGAELFRADDASSSDGARENSLDLPFASLTLFDGDVYNCTALVEASNGERLTISKQYTLIVQGIWNNLTNNTIFSCLLFIAEKPTVSVTTERALETLFEGSSITLNCTTSSVDNVSVAVTWYSSSSGHITQNTSRFTLIPATEQVSGVYMSTLSVNPLTLEQDDNTTYTCTGTAVPDNELTAEASDNASLTLAVNGKYLALHTEKRENNLVFFSLAIPPMSVTINTMGGNTAGDSLVLNCSVQVVQNLPAVPQIRWMRMVGNMEEVLLQSEEDMSDDVTLILPLEFNPVMTSDGGMYHCSASLNVPSINYMQNTSEEYNLTVTSERKYM